MIVPVAAVLAAIGLIIDGSSAFVVPAVNIRYGIRDTKTRGPVVGGFNLETYDPVRRKRITLKEAIPQGVKENEGPFSADSIFVEGMEDFAKGTRHYQNTYEVKEKHEKLSGGKGVRFNVETVPEPEPKHKKKSIVKERARMHALQKEAWGAYQEDADKTATQGSLRIETTSKKPDNLVFAGGNGFFAAALGAFAQHLPLAMSPDHIWCLITYAFAKHVDANAEELRHNLVKHEGKKRLLVNADHMVMGASPPEVWEATILPEFSKQIKEHIGEQVHSKIVANYTTTTATSKAAGEITLMSAMKHYFSFGVGTMCGIPTITLLGAEEDWVSLRIFQVLVAQAITSSR